MSDYSIVFIPSSEASGAGCARRQDAGPARQWLSSHRAVLVLV